MISYDGLWKVMKERGREIPVGHSEKVKTDSCFSLEKPTFP